MSNYNEQDTFNALTRPPVEEVDEMMLDAFGMEIPYCPILRNTYNIVLETPNDETLFLAILVINRWDVESYLKHTVIEWSRVED
jgi:hypothetical protein